ncbi:MAG: tyrosine-type recombinase/integrase [Thermoplasmata archaeon]
MRGTPSKGRTESSRPFAHRPVRFEGGRSRGAVRPFDSSPARAAARYDRRRADDWDAEVEAFVQSWQTQRLIGDRWAKGLRYILRRFRHLCAGSDSLPRIRRSSDVTDLHVTALRTGRPWARSTTQFYFAGLRQFLRWSENPVSEQPEIWRLPPAASSHRRWITGEQLTRLLRRAPGPSRLIVALEGFNGLRRVEVLRLRAKDVNLEERWLNVRGKGRMGGKWRQIPLSEVARSEVAGRLRGLAPDDRLLPYSASWADQQLAAAVVAARFEPPGLRVSHHDLRRTFGRVAHAAGMDLVQLKNLYGHASLEMSVHYIGLDLDRMREGLGRIDRALVPLLREEPPRGGRFRAPAGGAVGRPRPVGR